MRTGTLINFVGIVAGVLMGCAGDGADAASEADVTAGSSQLVLHYEPARKADVIKDRTFKAEDFVGNDVIVKDARTRIDIAVILPESDTSAPDRICYKGQVPAVSKILETMLGNTDGNGDHFLKPGSKVDADAAGKIKVRFTLIGEGGETSQALDVPRC
jgi:hypothetical protein